jgi:isoleucyl-tRNA synthetase
MYEFKKAESEVLNFWKEKDIYAKVKLKNSKGKKFYFLQGPPYTSGRIHIGTAWNNCLKDAALRFKRMQGLNVWDRAGYDMHGLPTENAVQKVLKLRDKSEIEKFGVDKFIKECRNFALSRVKEMDNDLISLGVWLDFKNAYYPLANDFMSNEWFLIKKAWEQKRLYKGKKVMHWCANCETALAKHELEYENVKERSIFAKLKVKGKKNEFLIVWTTTPWTLPFNLAVMANPKVDYVKAKTDDETWIFAKALSESLSKMSEKTFKITEEIAGNKLKGLEYDPLFNEGEMKQIYADMKKKYKAMHTVVLSEQYVTTDVGSGLVHCAPGCGPEDYEVGLEYNLPAFNTLDEKGIFTELPDFKGFAAKKDDAKIIEMLKEKESLVFEMIVDHEYPFCWRCHKPVIFRAMEQWFLKIEDLVPEMLKANEKVNWIPKWGKNAFDSWISALRDNSITRQRYWGTPVPIWECSKCKSIEVIGSQDELQKKAITKVPEDLHKPWIDDVRIKCKCGSEMKRVPDVLDVWLDAGTTSWNCLYYPSREDYFKEWFPAEFIIEANEQIKLWFSMLMICSMVALKKPCYKNVYMHGMILDWQGMKMSKSLGNIVSPSEVIEKYGVDLFRYYMCECRAGENIAFSWEGMKQKQRNMNVLWNVKNYLLEMASLLNKNPETIKPSLGLEEKYILSRCNSTIKEATELFENYQLDETITKIESLFLELSRVYIQLVRDKAGGTEKEKETVLYTIYETMTNVLKLFAPICPFITETMHQEMKEKFKLKEESIHFCEWPKADEKMIDKKLEQEFIIALEVIEKALAARAKEAIGVRWPLASLTIRSDKKIGKELQEIVMRQANVKKIITEKGKEKELEVSLDTKMTPELEAEGYSRELMRAVQGLRKKAGLLKDQKIDLEIATDKKLLGYMKKYEKAVKKKVNASKIAIAEKISGKHAHNFEEKIKEHIITIAFDIIA